MGRRRRAGNVTFCCRETGAPVGIFTDTKEDFDQTNKRYVLLFLMQRSSSSRPNKVNRVEEEKLENEVLRRRRKKKLFKMVLIVFCIFRHSCVSPFPAPHLHPGCTPSPSPPPWNPPTLYLNHTSNNERGKRTERAVAFLCIPSSISADGNGKGHNWCVADLHRRVQNISSCLHCGVYGHEDVDWRGRCSKCLPLPVFVLK